MLPIDWQTGLALVCVVLAALVIVRRVWVFLHPVNESCGGGCSGCPGKPAQGAPELPVVTLSGPFSPR